MLAPAAASSPVATNPIPESGAQLTAAAWRMAIGQAVVDAGVDKDYRGREKASDHAATWIVLD